MDRRNATKFHAEATLHAQLHNAKIKPLEEILDPELVTALDDIADKALEEYARKRLQERQAAHG
jgi:hypothetical protein